MSLNDIALHPHLLGVLYENSLISTTATDGPQKKTAVYLGNNNRNVIVVVRHEGVPFLPDSELQFLTSILSACKLSLADIAIMNLSTSGAAAVKEQIESSATAVLLFGVAPEEVELPIRFPPFRVQSFDNRSFLHAPSLSTIGSEKSLKMQLWNNLKTVFNIQ